MWCSWLLQTSYTHSTVYLTCGVPCPACSSRRTITYDAAAHMHAFSLLDGDESSCLGDSSWWTNTNWAATMHDVHDAVSHRSPCHPKTMRICCQLYPHIELLLDEEGWGAELPVQNKMKWNGTDIYVHPFFFSFFFEDGNATIFKHCTSFHYTKEHKVVAPVHNKTRPKITCTLNPRRSYM